MVFYFHYKCNKQNTLILCGQGMKEPCVWKEAKSPKYENHVLVNLKSVYKASTESTAFLFFSETCFLSVMKVGQPVDIFTTERLLTLRSQTVFWKDSKKLVPKRKFSKEGGITTNECINSWVTYSPLNIFLKLFDKHIKADGLLIFQRGKKRQLKREPN